MTTTCLTVVVDRPEATLVRAGIGRLLQEPDLDLVLVVPSQAAPAAGWIDELARTHSGRCAVLAVDGTDGPGEAVRRGLQTALSRAPDIAGYVWDGFATPPEEVLRLRDVMRARTCAVVVGARVAMLGTDIHRSVLRHYLGRAFAMAASTILRTDIYDTQCGAKLFRPSPALAAAVAQPFMSRIVFDVELLGRLLAGGPDGPPLTERDIIEVPLRSWDGRSAPSLSQSHALVATQELLRLGLKLRFSGERRR